jgi:hypothetical protein
MQVPDRNADDKLMPAVGPLLPYAVQSPIDAIEASAEVNTLRYLMVNTS